MLDPNERIANLERETRRLRRSTQALGLALAVALTLGATSDPKELVLRKLSIVDADGTPRIVAQAAEAGWADVTHFDRKGRKRIASGTDGSLAAHSVHFDSTSRGRVQVGTGSDDSARLVIYGRGGGVAWAETLN